MGQATDVLKSWRPSRQGNRPIDPRVGFEDIHHALHQLRQAIRAKYPDLTFSVAELNGLVRTIVERETEGKRVGVRVRETVARWRRMGRIDHIVINRWEDCST